ncbi:MAG: TIGR02206 family membrane protein [Nocardioides sp.]
MSTFETFGPSHLVMLVICLAAIPLVVRMGRAQRGTVAARRTSRIFALAIVAFTIPMQVLDFLPGRFDLDTTLPIQLCDFAWVAASVALWTHHRFFVALTYFWGLVLTTQALVTPWLNADFPDPRFIGYWVMHLLIVWAAIYLTWGLGLTPRWRDYATTVAATAAWAAAVYAFDVATGTNYGFLVHKPSSASLLDHLGPWPAYVLAEVAIIAAVWALMTWPWARRDQPRATCTLSASVSGESGVPPCSAIQS